MGKTYKNQSSKNYRVEANRRTVDATMAGQVSLALYAKVMGRLGEGRMRVYYEENGRGHEGVAKIRGLLRRRGQVPIQTNDIVILTPREFEAERAKKHFDIIGVLNMKQASELHKNSMIPEYFLHDITSVDTKKVSTEAYEFDYNDDDLDIDNI